MGRRFVNRFYIINAIFLVTVVTFTGCFKPEDGEYGPNHPDPYPAHWNAAQLDSIIPGAAYPTDTVLISGSGFDTSSAVGNFVYFDKVDRAEVTEVWRDSLRVVVPLPYPLDFFLAGTVGVFMTLQGSYCWSDTIPFIYKPMTSLYTANVYPANHPEEKFTKASGLAFDKAGNMYLVNGRLRSVYQDTPEGERSVYAFMGKFDGGMRMGPDEYLYVAGNKEGIIYRIPPGGGSYEEWVKVPNPWGMDFDSYGNLFVMDNVNGHLYKISADGQVKQLGEIPGEGEKAYCRVCDEYVYVNAQASGFYLRLPVIADSIYTAGGFCNADTVSVGPGIEVKDLTFDENGTLYFAGSEAGVNKLFKLESPDNPKALFELDIDMGFISWYRDFMYISNLSGSDEVVDHIYRVLIHGATPAPYYGRQ